MASNAVEAVLRSKYEDGIEAGVENTRELMEKTFASMKDAGAAASSAIEAAFQSTVGALDSWQKNLSKAADESDNQFKRISLGAAAMGVAFATVALRAAKAAADFLVEITKEASEVAAARVEFEHLTAAQGENADVMLGKLKQATEGQVGQLTLLQNANKVLRADLPLTGEQYLQLAENVAKLVKSTGTDAVAAQDALTTALIRGQSRALGPAIGVHLAVKDAVTEMADAMNSSAAAMPDHTKLQAFYNDLLEKTNAAVSQLGPQYVTLEEVLTHAKNAWHDWLDDLGTAITRSGVFQQVMEDATNALYGLSSGMDQQRAQALAVNDALIKLLQIFASLVQAVGYLSYAWDALKGVVVAVTGLLIGAVVDIGHAVNSMAIAVVEGLSMIPGAAGRAFQPVLDWLKKSQSELEIYRAAATETITHSFDGFGETAAKLSSFSDSTNKLAADMEKLRGVVLDGADGIHKHGAATQDAAADQKVLNEQLDKYREMLFSLNQAVADPAQKAMNQLAHDVAQIGKEFDKLSPEMRNELYAAAWAKYEAEEKKRLDEENARQKSADDKAYAEARQHAQEVLDLETEFDLKAADAEQKAAIEREQDIRKVAAKVGLTTEAGKRILLQIERAYDAEMEKIQQDRDRREQERQKKELNDALQAAAAIQHVIEAAAKGTIPENSALAAMKNIPQVLDTLKTKLAELNRQPVVTDQQIAQIEKLQAAIAQLNKINFRPFENALSQMKNDMSHFATQSLQSFSQYLGGLISGQGAATKSLLDMASKMIGGLFTMVGTLLIQTGVAECAAALTMVGRAMGASFETGALAIAAGVALSAIGSAMGGSGSSSGGSASAGGSSASSVSQANANPQTLNVGAPGQSGAVNTQTQHLVTVQIQSNDSHIVKVVKNNLQTNGDLRTVIK